MFYKRSLGSKVFDFINTIIMLLIIIVMIYPFLYVLSVSLSAPNYIVEGKVSWFPRGFNLQGYKLILSNSQIWLAYRNTILYALVGTVITLILTSMTAYPLSISDFVLKKQFTIFLSITMFFSGGLVPTYLLIKNLHLINTFWVMVIPGCISAYNIFIYRTFFQGMPAELRESAYLDGANDIVILFKIILPLSKALLATFGLFSIVGHWNSWFNALLYLNSEKKYPIQMILRQILFVIGADSYNDAAAQMLQSKMLNPKNIQMSVVILTCAPILCIYPFIQKYFVKGVMIGAIKG
jgi:putative aldouronate transport system permease protein